MMGWTHVGPTSAGRAGQVLRQQGHVPGGDEDPPRAASDVHWLCQPLCVQPASGEELPRGSALPPALCPQVLPGPRGMNGGGVGSSGKVSPCLPQGVLSGLPAALVNELKISIGKMVSHPTYFTNRYVTGTQDPYLIFSHVCPWGRGLELML